MEKLELVRLTERIWYSPFEVDRDRPNLGYICGDNWSLAVDAGHSEAHTRAFYRALEDAGLPLPALTVLTHWHWDHTFGMHAVHGLCLANQRSNGYLLAARDRILREGPEAFLSMDISVRKEYKENRPMIVRPADLVFSGEIWLDAGGCPIRVFQADAPHTDDSTLVEAPGEKILFLGDAAGGVFPTWEKDPQLCRKLADCIAASGASIFLEGHWTPVSKEEMISDLLSSQI